MTTATDALNALAVIDQYLLEHPDAPTAVSALQAYVTATLMPVVDLPNIPAFATPATATAYAGTQIKTSGKTYTGITSNTGGLTFKVPTGGYMINGFTVSQMYAPKTAGVMRTYGGSLSNATFEDLNLPNVVYDKGVCGSVFLALNTTLKNITFRRIRAHLTTPITDSGDNYGAFSLSGKDANDVGDTISWEDIEVKIDAPGVAYTDSPNAYKNRDGFAVEAGYTNLSLNRIYVSGAPDGGIDMKSPSCVIDNYTGENNNKTLRQWHPCHHKKIHSKNPGKYHFMMMGDGTREIDFVKITDTGNKPVVHWASGGSVGNGPRVVKINQLDLSGVPDPTKIVWLEKEISDPCEVHLPDGTVIKK